MAPSSKDLDQFRDRIERRLRNMETHQQILDWLHSEGHSISRRTLLRRLKRWNISTRSTTAGTDATLITAIRDEFHSTNSNDSTIAATLTTNGIPTTANQVQEVRLRHGWRRRAANDEQLAEQRAETFQMVQEELEEGTIRAYGRELTKTHLLTHRAYRAREDDVRDALRKLDDKGTAARKPGPKRRRKRGGEYIVRGPDWLWCIDGHDKFRNYGIQIYAAVDAFSRKILWFYIGNSNRRGVSVLRQALTTIRSLGRCPRFWRSDHGSEVLLLADAHFSFYREHKRSQGLTDDEVDSLRVRQCYMFGTSTANLRVENVWMRMIGSQTATWIVSTFPLHPRAPVSFCYLVIADRTPASSL